MTLQEFECMLNRPSLSIAPKLEFDAPGCHSLLRPLLLQYESCGWKSCPRCLPKPKCRATTRLVRHRLRDVEERLAPGEAVPWVQPPEFLPTKVWKSISNITGVVLWSVSHITWLILGQVTYWLRDHAAFLWLGGLNNMWRHFLRARQSQAS